MSGLKPRRLSKYIEAVIRNAFEQGTDPATAVFDYYEESGSNRKITWSHAQRLVDKYRTIHAKDDSE